MLQTKLSNNLQYLMQNRGVTSVDLAEELSLAAEVIVKLKNGEFTNPSLNTVLGLSKYFDVTLEKLLFNDLSAKSELI